MDRSSGKRFLNSFLKIFVILFILIVILPLVVDNIMHFFNWGIAPKSNSIIVFKDLVGEQKVIIRLISTLKKIFIFM